MGRKEVASYRVLGYICVHQVDIVKGRVYVNFLSLCVCLPAVF